MLCCVSQMCLSNIPQDCWSLASSDLHIRCDVAGLQIELALGLKKAAPWQELLTGYSKSLLRVGSLGVLAVLLSLFVALSVVRLFFSVVWHSTCFVAVSFFSGVWVSLTSLHCIGRRTIRGGSPGGTGCLQ